MKWFVNLLVLAGAGVFGYYAEPSLRLELTGLSPKPQAPVASEPDNSNEQLLARVELREYAPDQLPKEIVLKKDAQVTDASSGLKMTIPSGSRVKFLRLGMGTLIIGTGAPNIEGEVEVHDTDMREQVLLNPPAKLEAGAVAAAPGSAKPAPQMDAMAQAEPEGTGTPEPAEGAEKSAEPGETAAADPNMKADPAADKPEEAAADPGTFTAASADDIVKIMQESIQAGQIKEIKFDSVTEWAGSEPETLDGKQYNVGVVAYKGQTFLGVKTSRAKAYINGGKVIRWIGAKSGMDLK